MSHYPLFPVRRTVPSYSDLLDSSRTNQLSASFTENSRLAFCETTSPRLKRAVLPYPSLRTKANPNHRQNPPVYPVETMKNAHLDQLRQFKRTKSTNDINNDSVDPRLLRDSLFGGPSVANCVDWSKPKSTSVLHSYHMSQQRPYSYHSQTPSARTRLRLSSSTPSTTHSSPKMTTHRHSSSLFKPLLPPHSSTSYRLTPLWQQIPATSSSQPTQASSYTSQPSAESESSIFPTSEALKSTSSAQLSSTASMSLTQMSMSSMSQTMASSSIVHTSILSPKLLSARHVRNSDGVSPSRKQKTSEPEFLNGSIPVVVKRHKVGDSPPIIDTTAMDKASTKSKRAAVDGDSSDGFETVDEEEEEETDHHVTSEDHLDASTVYSHSFRHHPALPRAPKPTSMLSPLCPTSDTRPPSHSSSPVIDVNNNNSTKNRFPKPAKIPQPRRPREKRRPPTSGGVPNSISVASNNNRAIHHRRVSSWDNTVTTNNTNTMDATTPIRRSSKPSAILVNKPTRSQTAARIIANSGALPTASVRYYNSEDSKFSSRFLYNGRLLQPAEEAISNAGSSSDLSGNEDDGSSASSGEEEEFRVGSSSEDEDSLSPVQCLECNGPEEEDGLGSLDEEDSRCVSGEPEEVEKETTEEESEPTQPFFSHSFYPHVPPTIHFVEEGERVEKVEKVVPVEMKKLLKWRLSGITPVVVKRAIARSGFTISKKSYDWIGYFGHHMKAAGFRTIREYQKVNHLPGSFQIGRKDRLWTSLSRMQTSYGRREFNFFPRTYTLPADLKRLKRVWEEGGPKQKWIIKPPASARGLGIRVISKWTQVPKRRPVIVQKYLHRPYLINNSKFDLRLYVLVTSMDPLRVYIHEEGLVRFATEPYSSCMRQLSNRFIHLTNYSVNKKNDDYKKSDFNPEEETDGHKWRLSTLWAYLQERGVNTTSLWHKIRDLSLKTICAADSAVNSMIKMYCRRRGCAYELFGLDVLLDSSLKPWILEVNISPSLHSNSPLDVEVKSKMISDLFNLVGFQFPDPVDIGPSSAQACAPVTPGYHPPTPITADKRLWDPPHTADQRAKHAFYTQRATDDHIQSTILDVLTPDDVRILVESLDEFRRCGNFQRLFPRQGLEGSRYLRFVSQPRYYNLLLHAFLTKFHKSEEKGDALISSLCFRKVHLQCPALSSQHQWTPPFSHAPLAPLTNTQISPALAPSFHSAHPRSQRGDTSPSPLSPAKHPARHASPHKQRSSSQVHKHKEIPPFPAPPSFVAAVYKNSCMTFPVVMSPVDSPPPLINSAKARGVIESMAGVASLTESKAGVTSLIEAKAGVTSLTARRGDSSPAEFS